MRPVRRNRGRFYFRLGQLTKKQIIFGSLVGVFSGVFIYKPLFDEIRKENPEVLVGTTEED